MKKIVLILLVCLFLVGCVVGAGFRYDPYPYYGPYYYGPYYYAPYSSFYYQPYYGWNYRYRPYSPHWR